LPVREPAEVQALLRAAAELRAARAAGGDGLRGAWAWRLVTPSAARQGQGGAMIQLTLDMTWQTRLNCAFAWGITLKAVGR